MSMVTVLVTFTQLHVMLVLLAQQLDPAPPVTAVHAQLPSIVTLLVKLMLLTDVLMVSSVLPVLIDQAHT